MKIFNGIINILNKPYEMSILIDYDKETYYTNMFVKIHQNHIIKYNIKIDKTTVKINGTGVAYEKNELRNKSFFVGTGVAYEKNELRNKSFFVGTGVAYEKKELLRNFFFVGTIYNIDIIEKNNEIFIIGKEEPGLLYYLTCCLMPRNFFIISNKEIV